MFWSSEFGADVHPAALSSGVMTPGRTQSAGPPAGDSRATFASPGDPATPRTAPADWPPGSRHSFEFCGTRFDLIEWGDGPPLVLLPPMPGWKEAYVGLVRRLAARHRVLTFDLRTRFDGPPSWDALVADCEAIAEARFGSPVALFGHSLGGALALGWAVSHPERVRAMVVSSGFARVFTPRHAWVARWVEQPLALAGMRWLPERFASRLASRLAGGRRWVFDEHCSPDVVEQVLAGIRRTPLGLIRRRVALAMSLDLRGRLGGLRCPTLLLTAEHDTPFASEAVEELVAGIPHAERRVIPGAGHLHPLSRPDRLAAEVIGWLDGRATC